MDSKQTYCGGEHHKSNTIDKIEYERRNPLTNKIVKVEKRKCDICGRSETRICTR